VIARIVAWWRGLWSSPPTVESHLDSMTWEERDREADRFLPPALRRYPSNPRPPRMVKG